jgi:hypothetical protein
MLINPLGGSMKLKSIFFTVAVTASLLSFHSASANNSSLELLITEANSLVYENSESVEIMSAVYSQLITELSDTTLPHSIRKKLLRSTKALQDHCEKATKKQFNYSLCINKP